jgi:hypothetical protein
MDTFWRSNFIIVDQTLAQKFLDLLDAILVSLNSRSAVLPYDVIFAVKNYVTLL